LAQTKQQPLVAFPGLHQAILLSNGSDFGLVGGLNPSEKYEFVSWEYYFQYMEK
jgi:hypothetical protein